MNNLSIFEVPTYGEVTLCEVDGKVHSMHYEFANIAAFTNSLETHPNIHITPNLLHRRSDEGKSVFVTVDEPFLKRLIHAYYEHGMIEMLNTAEEFGPSYLKNIVSVVFLVLNGVKILRNKLTSTTIENDLTLMSCISHTRFWMTSSIRCIAWDSYDIKIAVATCDDAIRIYSHNSNFIPILKCKQQKNITCLAWRPFSNSELAVGCENGIFVWNIDQTSMITRPSINNASILRRINHVPVVSIAWSPTGDILASAAARDPSILIWHVERNETSTLSMPGSHGNCLVKWSPRGNKLLTATVERVFRIWNCETWTSERWNVLTGRIQACCWSPCEGIVLFVSNTEPIIYALSFTHLEMIFATSENSATLATPLYDLSRGEIDGVIIGGTVQNMEWDPRNNIVAVLFQDTNYVAIFKVTIDPTIHLNPCCLVAGVPDEKPVCISFQGNFEHGACLSIGWSSGRVQHFPIVRPEATTSSSISKEFYNSSSFHNSGTSFKSP
uniref:Aladin seven-bladed propeller domain-containing protein n=2 Tax=Photinus pyralis TaxID=7054 RepID=A0A1Y1ND83_PHOPY